jgi:protein-export membrane protein SecD
MRNSFGDYVWLLVIIVILAFSIWLVQDPNHPIRRGLDLQGGLQVLLESSLSEDIEVTPEQMDTARQIIDQRVNALGVTEPVVQVEPEQRRILVELPGLDNPEDAIALIQETALLEFIDTQTQPLEEGTCVVTSENTGPSPCQIIRGEGDEEDVVLDAPFFQTVMTGAALNSSSPQRDELGTSFFVEFSLHPDQAEFFADYTRSHVGQFLTIVLDKEVISSPRIESAIDGGQGTITGDFTAEEAEKLSLQLRFGSLPIPLEIESIRQVGATLGTQSVEASIRAGAVGVILVLLFMLAYYRMFGLMADLALLFYMLLNFAIFQGLPVTLTLPAITGFLLSTGMAVDANVLVFERIKEELGRGSSLRPAIDNGFSLAWVSIRDSNIATLVICLVLWMFGRSFGASAVQGFALTLAIGVMISMFTAVIVSRTFVRLVIGGAADYLEGKKLLLGA